MARSPRSAVFVLVLVAVNFALFLPAMKGGFFWDDKILISGNPYLAHPNFLKTFLTSPFTGPSGWDQNSAALDRRVPFYRPLTALSYWADLKIWGLNPAGFHLTNILLQIANAVLFYFVLARLGLGAWPAFLGGLLFSAFPPHFESVGWISGRTDLISFAGAAAALLGALRYRKAGRTRWLVFSSSAYFLALMAKESVILLPGILILLLVAERGRKRTLAAAAAFLPPVLIWGILRSLAVGPPVPGISFQAAGRALAALGFYGFKLVFPFRLGLTVDAGRIFGNAAAFGFGAFVAVLILASWAVCLVRLTRFHRVGERREGGWGEVAAAGAVFGLLIFPALLVVFLGGVESFLACRFLYFVSGFVVYLVVRLVCCSFRKEAFAAALLAALTAFYAVELIPKNRLYGIGKGEDIWRAVEHPAREDALARLNIGLAWLEKDEARGIAVLQSVLDETGHPNAGSLKTKVFEDLAAYYTRRKDPEKAGPYFRELFRSGVPQSSYFYLNYAVFLAQSGRAAEGEKIVEEMLGLFPENHLVLLNAARFYATVGDDDRAADCLRKDYALFPSPQALDEIRALDLFKK